MKKSRKVIIGVVLGASLVAGVTAIAHQGKRYWHHDDQHRAEWIVDKVTDKLDLAPDQAGKLTVLVAEVQAFKNTMKADRAELRDDLMAMITAETVDQQKLIDIITAKTSLVNTSAPQLVAALADFADNLTAEQKAELQGFLEHRVGHRWHHHDDDDN